jgi:SAM-dependent methyltransferase
LSSSSGVPVAPSSAFWNERARLYDSEFDQPGAFGHALRSRLDVTLEALGNGPGSILDAGMGPGRLCAILAERAWTVSGIDASDEMVTLARLRLPEARERLLLSPIEAIPLEDGSFDAVVATGVLEFATVPTALAEIARLLRPGGRAVVSYPNPRAAYRRWKTWVYYPAVRALKRLERAPETEMPRGAGPIPPERFRALLEGLDLVVESERYTSAIPVLSPFELLFPRATESLAGRLEGSRGFVARQVATQIVFVARKAA